MIDLTLDFLCKQINEYLVRKLNLNATDTAIMLYNVSQLGSESAGGGNNSDTTTNAFLTLVNIEEDRISKSQDNFIRKDGRVLYQNPKVHLNLHLLFSVNLSSYTESLKRLSYIIQFFQYQNVFTSLTSPGLPNGVEELIFDLYTLSMQDLNNMWGILGSKYLPSIMYKMRMITISEDFVQGEAGLITKININSKNIQQ
jgi:hypothetical protein